MDTYSNPITPIAGAARRACSGIIPLLLAVGALALAAPGAAFADGGGSQGLNVTPPTGPTGASVTSTATGFNSGDTVVIGFSPNSNCSGATPIPGATGKVTSTGPNGGTVVVITFPWPSTATGQFYVCASDPTSGQKAHSTVPYDVVPQGTITVPDTVYSGQSFTVTGAHFEGSSPSGSSGSVDILYGPSLANDCATPAGTANVNPDGSFTTTVTAPQATSPTKITVVAVEPQASCGKSGAAGPTFQAQQTVNVSPPASITVTSPVSSGASVTVTGQHFLPASSSASGTVQVSYGPDGSNGCATSKGTATVGSDGSFTFSFAAPAETNDTHLTVAAVEPADQCAQKPPSSATASVLVKGGSSIPIWQYCLIGLLLLLLLLLLLFVVFRARRQNQPVTIEERDRVVVPPGGGTRGPGAYGGAPLIDRQIVARRGGKEVVIAEEVTTVEEEEEELP